jgi:hypothetical protein
VVILPVWPLLLYLYIRARVTAMAVPYDSISSRTPFLSRWQSETIPAAKGTATAPTSPEVSIVPLVPAKLGIANSKKKVTKMAITLVFHFSSFFINWSKPPMK